MADDMLHEDASSDSAGHPVAAKTLAFAAYVLRVGPYAGQRLSVVAAVDPTWLLITLATADMEAVDATAVRGFLSARPRLVVGDGTIMGPHPLVTIAPVLIPGGTAAEPQWNVRVAGGAAGSFVRLGAARAFCEATWGVQQWVRVAKGVLIGEAHQSTGPSP